MYWIAAGLFGVGAACGAAVRLVAFLMILAGAAVIAGVSAWLRGDGGSGAVILYTGLSVVMLQVGYVAGVVLRSGLPPAFRRVADYSKRR
jgi:hypothetical protein